MIYSVVTYLLTTSFSLISFNFKLVRLETEGSNMQNKKGPVCL